MCFRDPFNKGKLIIIFNTTYPDKLDPTTAKKIAALLPKIEKPIVPKDAENVKLEVFDGKKYTLCLSVCLSTMPFTFVYRTGNKYL